MRYGVDSFQVFKSLLRVVWQNLRQVMKKMAAEHTCFVVYFIEIPISEDYLYDKIRENILKTYWLCFPNRPLGLQCGAVWQGSK